MPKALSIDFCRRVIKAIVDGASCRQAAACFGAGTSSAIRWRALSRTAVPYFGLLAIIAASTVPLLRLFVAPLRDVLDAQRG